METELQVTASPRQEPQANKPQASPRGVSIMSSMVASHAVTHDEEGQFGGLAEHRLQLALFLESNAVQSSILGLVLVEMLCVLVEIFLAEEVLDLRGHDHKLKVFAEVYAFQPSANLSRDDFIKLHMDDCDNPPILCHSCCHNENYTVHHTLHIISITIMGIFAIELALLVAALGSSFWKHFWYVLDFILVYVTLFAELVLQSQAAGMLVFLRSWRLVRIVHSFVASIEAHQSVQHNANHIKDALIEDLRTQSAVVNDIGAQLMEHTGKSATDLGISNHMRTEDEFEEHIKNMSKSRVVKHAEAEKSASRLRSSRSGGDGDEDGNMEVENPVADMKGAVDSDSAV